MASVSLGASVSCTTRICSFSASTLKLSGATFTASCANRSDAARRESKDIVNFKALFSGGQTPVLPNLVLPMNPSFCGQAAFCPIDCYDRNHLSERLRKESARSVKGGAKLDQCGGVKVDQGSRQEIGVCRGGGRLERRPAPPARRRV